MFPLPPTACAWLDLEWWWLGQLWPPVTVSRRCHTPCYNPAGPASSRTLDACTTFFDTHTVLLSWGGSTTQTEANWLAYSPHRIL
ncbi:hypothetical protein C8R46DRAFT_1067141 [Mycena filopes]|nr:hypothetical protein C8R46DRAFT_1067122 [Mycena filopes]KAJ7183496.1 hypothetical protein C8R46DRAFT_1067131 [Mycena filopes]KAJ7183498.1 hypothetical protein C8R46DRAFT_1067141 [Mycena filopes]